MVVILVRRVGEPREETDGVANVQTTDDAGVNQFAENITVGETDLVRDRLGLWSLLGRTFEKHKGTGCVGVQWNGLGRGIRLFLGSIPSMGLEHTVDVRLRADLDVILGLENVNAVVSLVDATGGFYTHGGVFGFDMAAQFGDEFFGSFLRRGSGSEIIHLAADEYLVAVDMAEVQVLLVSGILENPSC